MQRPETGLWDSENCEWLGWGQLCSVDGAQEEERRLTLTEPQYSPVRHNRDCAHCVDEESKLREVQCLA